MGILELFQAKLDAVAASVSTPRDLPPIDFTKPYGEPALTQPDSVSWQVFRNPVTVAIGGIAAVILELAEPRVRSGVWDHSGFRQNPVQRLRRTGMAAMITVYGARSGAERMIAGVSRMHARVRGQTPEGETYRAMDPALLTWVHATASFGFLEAFHRYAMPVSSADRDRLFSEGRASADLYGASSAPQSETERVALFDKTLATLSPSPIVFQFLDMMRNAPLLPSPFRRIQRLIVSAAVEIVPAPVRDLLGLGPDRGLSAIEHRMVRMAAQAAQRIVLPSSPASQACVRLGLSPNDVFKARSSR